MSNQNFEYLSDLPLDAGESVAAMTVWEALGKNCIVIATNEGRMFVLRVSAKGRLDIAGPLQFIPSVYD